MMPAQSLILGENKAEQGESEKTEKKSGLGRDRTSHSFFGFGANSLRFCYLLYTSMSQPLDLEGVSVAVLCFSGLCYRFFPRIYIPSYK